MSTKERTSEEELTLVDSVHENEIIHQTIITAD